MNKSFLSKAAFFAGAGVVLLSCSTDDTPQTMENTAPKISPQAFSVSEDVDDTMVLGKTIASDADGDALSFSIKTNSSDLFKISDSGAISLIAGELLDYESEVSHTLSVDVSDGKEISNAAITITVLDVAENPGVLVGANQSTVTKTRITQMRDADRSTIYDENGRFEKYIYDFSGNKYNIAVYGAKTENTYEIKLTGRTIANEFTKELVSTKSTATDLIVFELTTTDFHIDPDTYDAVIVEKETNKEFELESLELRSNPNDVPYDITTSVAAFNMGPIEFSDVTYSSKGAPSFSDSNDIDLSDSQIVVRSKNASAGEFSQLEIYTLNGVHVKTITSLSAVLNRDYSVMYFTMNPSLFSDVVTGTYLFRLAENADANQFPGIVNSKSELAEYRIISNSFRLF